MDAMSVNAKGKWVRGRKILLYGKCVEDGHPEILQKFEDFTKLSFCPEEEHINMLFYKLIAMMSVAKNLTILTVDGSPHCVQMHYIAEEVLKYLEKKFEVRHFVINNGKLMEISSEAVKISRYLSKIQRMIDTHS